MEPKLPLRDAFAFVVAGVGSFFSQRIHWRAARNSYVRDKRLLVSLLRRASRSCYPSFLQYLVNLVGDAKFLFEFLGR